MSRAPAPAPPPGVPKARRFVSYSHRDSLQAREFREHLELAVRGVKAQEKAEWDVFFDAGSLKPGDKWNDRIAEALEGSSLFVFLMSKNSLLSPFCVEKELATAVRLGIRVVPVLLEHCVWRHLPLPGDPARDSMEHVQVIPHDDEASLVAVADWPRPAVAWTRVLDQLQEFLDAPPPRRPPLPAAGRAAAARHVPPLLPYLCNQKPQVEGFDYQLRLRRREPGRALVVLVKGTSADEPKQFWNRLREEHLAAGCGALSCLADGDLDWPRVHAMLDDEAYVRAQVEMKLSRAITPEHDANAIETPVQLAAHLSALAGVKPLVADFPPEPAEALKATLLALLEFLEACPEGADLSRLVLVLLVIDAPDLIEGRLVKQWELQRFKRCQLVELDPLVELTEGDVKEWHDDCHIADQWQLPSEPVLRLFEGAARMRAGAFAKAVRPLLLGGS